MKAGLRLLPSNRLSASVTVPARVSRILVPNAHADSWDSVIFHVRVVYETGVKFSCAQMQKERF